MAVFCALLLGRLRPVLLPPPGFPRRYRRLQGGVEAHDLIGCEFIIIDAEIIDKTVVTDARADDLRTLRVDNE